MQCCRILFLCLPQSVTFAYISLAISISHFSITLWVYFATASRILHFQHCERPNRICLSFHSLYIELQCSLLLSLTQSLLLLFFFFDCHAVKPRFYAYNSLKYMEKKTAYEFLHINLSWEHIKRCVSCYRNNANTSLAGESHFAVQWCRDRVERCASSHIITPNIAHI